MGKHLALSVPLMGWLCLTGVGFAAEAKPPHPIAVNHGVYRPAQIEKVIRQGAAAWKSRSTNRDVVQHLRVEIFENSKAATRAQTTLFALCESTFQLTVPDGKILSKVTAELVTLDAFGKPVSKKTRRFTYVSTYRDKKWVWAVTSSDGRDVRAFYQSLPDWGKQRLCLLSGFLHDNPGSQPVPYAKTVEEDLVGLLDVVVSLGPGVAKTVLGTVAENIAKTLARKTLKDAVQSKDLRWGGGPDVRNDKVDRYKARYIKTGKTIWE